MDACSHSRARSRLGRLSRALRLGAFSLALAPAAFAAETLDPFDLSPEQLFDATVTLATRTDETWWRTPAAVYVVTSQDIARSGATTIAEALRVVPGLHVARFNASGWAISSRGFNSDLTNKLLVLIDGRQVYNHLFSGVYWDIQDTPLEDIERIEVIRGPGATLWGSNAVNGVINVITKPAARTQGTLLSARAGNEGAGAVARHGTSWREGARVRVYGKYLLRDEQHATGSGGGEDRWSAIRSGFRSDWDGRRDGEGVTIQGDVYRSRARQLRDAPLLIAPFSVTQTERVDSTGANLLGRVTRDVGEAGRLTLQGYVDYTLRRGLLVDDRYTAGDLDLQYELAPAPWCEIVAGAGYRYTISNLSGSSLSSFRDDTRRDDVLGSFVQTKLWLVPARLALTLGAKLEHNDYSGTEVQPTARLEWSPTPRQVFWASIARAVRTPSRLEHDVDIDLDTIPPGVLPLPVLVQLDAHPDFESERVVAYEVGARFEWSPAFRIDVAAFHNDYANLATNTLATPSVVINGIDPPFVLLPVQVRNTTEGRAVGFEVVATWQPLDALRLSASYDVLDLELSGPDSTVAIAAEQAERRAPDDQLRLQVHWELDDRTALSTSLHYVDELPAFDVDSHWRLDVRLRRRIGSQLEASIVGKDLLTRGRREFFERSTRNATEIQRSVYAQVTWRY